MSVIAVCPSSAPHYESLWQWAQARQKAGDYDDALLFDDWTTCIGFFDLRGPDPDDAIYDAWQGHVAYHYVWNGAIFVPNDKPMANRVWARAHANCTVATHGHPVPFEAPPYPWL